MKKISLLKKISLFRFFSKKVDEIESELDLKFGIRIDNASRLYTVINVPKESIGEAFSLRTNDINTISESYIKEYSRELSEYMRSKDLSELFKFYSIKKVDKYSYLLIFGFSLFNSSKFYNRIYIAIFSTMLLLISFGLSLLFMKLLNF